MGGEAARHEDGRQYPAAQDQYGRGPWRQVRPLRKPPRNGGGIRLHPLAVRRRGSMKAASSPRFALSLSKPVLSRSEEHTSEFQSLMRISYAVFCLKKKIKNISEHMTHNKHCIY